MAGIRSLVIKIGAQTEEIDRALAKIGATTKSTAAELKELEKTAGAQQAIRTFNDMKVAIDGIAQAQERHAERARLAAAGIDKIGGSSRLMKTELDAVNRTLQTGIDAYRALGQQAPADLRRVSDEVTRQRAALEDLQKSNAGGFFNDLKTHIVGTAAGFVSAQAVIGGLQAGFRTLTQFVGDSVKSFQEAEKAQKTLTTALQAQKTATPAVISQYNNLASSFEKTTVFADDLITSSEALLVQIGDVMPSQMEGALQATTNLAAGLGIDLDSATRLVAKAAAGHTETLGKYGIVVSEADLKTRGFDAVLEAINKQFGGQAQAAVDTYAGRIAQAANAFDNFKEIVGELVVGNAVTVAALRGLSDLIKGVTVEADRSATPLANLATSLNIPISPTVIASFELYLGALNEIDTMRQRLANTPSPFAASNAASSLPVMPPSARAAIDAELKAAEDRRKAAEAQKKANEDYAKALDAVNKKIAEGEKPITQLSQAQQRLTLRYREFGLSAQEIALKLGVTSRSVEAFTKGTDDMERHFRHLWDSVDHGGSTIAHIGTVIRGDFDNSLKAAGEEAVFMERHFRRLWDSVDHGGNSLRNIGQSFGKLDIEIKKSLTWTDTLAGMERILSGVQTQFAQMAVVAVRAILEIDKTWKNSKISTSDKIGSSIVSGLSAAASIGGNTRAGRSLGGAATGAATGAAIGSIIPGIGTAIGAGVGAVAGGIASLFGGGEKKKVDEIRQALIDARGGWDAFNKSAHDAGTTLKDVLNARTVKDYERALNDLDKAIQFQDQAMATLEETTRKYGFTIDELGPAFQRQELDKQAQTLFQDFSVLTAAGIDLNTVVSKMAPSINEFLAAALRTGQEVPAAMKPMLEKMAEMGLLTDENGKKLDNLDGIKFSETMTEGFTRVVESVEKLTQAIARGLGLAIDTVQSKIKNIPPVNVDVNFNVGDIQNPFSNGDIRAATGGLVTAHGIQHFGAGGRVLPFFRRGTDTVPAMLTPGEIVLNAAQQSSVAASMVGGGGVATRELQAMVSGLRSDMARRDAEMPKMIARFVRDAVQTARVRR